MTIHEYTVRFDDVPVVPTADRRKIFADTLRQNAGRTATLGTMQNPNVARQYAYMIRKGARHMHMFAPAGSFEAETKTLFGTTHIFVRYVGEGS